MAEEVKKIRLINSEPTLANLLRTLEKRGFRIQMIPPEYRDYAISWVEDVGRIMRSRDYLAGTLAMYLSFAIVSVPFELMPTLKEFRLVARVLGVR